MGNSTSFLNKTSSIIENIILSSDSQKIQIRNPYEMQFSHCERVIYQQKYKQPRKAVSILEQQTTDNVENYY